MKRITRNQAAEKLGVTPQTISNYVQEGLLGGYKDKANTLYVNGDDVEDLAEYYGLTINRIRQLLQKAFYRFIGRSQLIQTSMRTNCQLEHEVNQLTKRLDDLRKQYYELKQSKDEETMDKTMIRPPKLFSKSLYDCGLSVRVANCLKAKDAYTVEDLMTVFHCLEDFKDMRNFGSKSYNQVEEFIENNHLVFKNPKESLEHFYYRQNSSFGSL